MRFSAPTAAGYDHGGALKLTSEDLGLDLRLFFTVAFEFVLKFHAAHDAGRSQAGEVLGDEVVAGESIGHFGEITDATDLVDVCEQDDFHILDSLNAADTRPGGVAVITARARATAW